MLKPFNNQPRGENEQAAASIQASTQVDTLDNEHWDGCWTKQEDTTIS